jgi:chromosome segregation ATPase
VSLTASDALALRQQGPEVTVSRLRQALEDATTRDLATKAALAKSDAVILELRGSMQKMKQQLEVLEKENKEQAAMQQQQQQNRSTTSNNDAASSEAVQQLQQQIKELQQRLATSSSKDAAVGELQVQLDRAHAQILTADMVRKELEDTLEAEQYTWELRVQDQERQIGQLQEECQRLQADLEDARSQWKEAEQGWNQQVQDLQQQLTQARTRLAATQALQHVSQDQEALQAKIQQLEKERSELQNCLDEALQELEAVDVELQEGKGTPTTTDVVESLQHLLRWIYQEGPVQNGSTVHNLSKDPKRLLKEIQHALEQWIRAINEAKSPPRNRGINGVGNSNEVADLKAQVKHYQEELKSREESSAELRESLKEAVALLKPLQDAVSSAEQDKQDLQRQVSEMLRSSQLYQKERLQYSKEIEKLRSEIVQLEQQVEEQKSIATARASLLASSSPLTPRTPPSAATTAATTPSTDDSLSKIQRAREELRRKRETEGNLQQLLKDAQNRFRTMHQQNEDVAAKNRELQGKLQEAETQMSSPMPSVEDQLAHVQHQLQDREAQVVHLQRALEASGNNKLHQMDQQLEQVKKELAAKEQTEKVLNKSLKDALGLLKPLQTHLEEAEREKLEISKELRNLRKRFRQLQMSDAASSAHDDQSKSTFGGDVSIELIKIKEELEETVRQLELENSQLHDALEDKSDNGAAEAKLRQKLVELNSRYEVTQNKLEDAHVENHALIKALKQKEADERKQAAELEHLRSMLEKSEAELKNAKAIAKTALMKVEELTMNSIEQMSLTGTGTKDMHFPVTASVSRY